MKKLFVLIAMMLCAVMVLSSCSLFTTTIKFKKFVQKDVEVDTARPLSTLSKLEIEGVEVAMNDYEDGYSKDVVVLVDTNPKNGLKTTTIYNIATNQIVWRKTDAENTLVGGSEKVEYSVTLKVLYVNDESVTMAIVEKATTTVKDKETNVVYDVTLLSENGTEVAVFKDINRTSLESSIWVVADLFCIQYKVYRVTEDGNASFAFDWSDLRQKPSVLMEKAGEYYVDYNMENKTVFVYDTNLELTATYVAPEYGGEEFFEDLGEVIFNVNVLSNGNVLVQYLVRQDIMAQKYSFLMLSQKYNLYSVLLQAKTGKVKKLQLDYLIEWVEYGTDLEYMGVSEKIENVAIGYAIEDQRINHNVTAAKVLSLTNKGHIAGVLEPPVMGAVFPDTFGFFMVGKNRWEISTVDGRTYMLDETGTVLGENFNVDDSNADVFMSNRRIYDWDLNLKADLQRDVTNLYFMEYGVLYQTQKGEAKFYYNDETQTLITESQAKQGKHKLQYLSGGAYMIIDSTSSTPQYKIYNAQGTLLKIITDQVGIPEVVKVAENGAILLRAQTEDFSMVYYRIG